MNFTFENQGTNTYLVYKIDNNNVIDTMSLGMITNNKITGLAPVVFTQMDTIKFIKYNISAHISVKQFFSGPVNKKRLIGVFNGIVDAMLSAEDYMIDINTILIDLDYIFADVSTCETVLICLPIICEENRTVDLGAFFKNVMFSTQFDQTENCDHVAKIMNYLNSTPTFSLVDFKKLLDELNAACTTQPVIEKTQKKSEVSVQKTIQSQPVVNTTESEKQKKAQLVNDISLKDHKTSVTPIKSNEVIQPQMQQSNTQTIEEKKISMFDLLMHYSKENAALYKAQKEASKTSAGNTAPSSQKKKKVASNTPVNTSFAIPGQSAPPPSAQVIQPNMIQQPVVTPQPTVPAVQTQKTPIKISQEVNVIQPATSVVSQTYQTNTVPQGQPMNFGETTVLGGGSIGETTVLGAAPSVAQPKPHLVRTKNNEKINLDKPVFRIGKEKSYVDYFISDNTAISRSHANFITRDNQYFVMDTNSTNHTYVNGSMIQSNVETKLNHGDKVRLANEDFEFKLY